MARKKTSSSSTPKTKKAEPEQTTSPSSDPPPPTSSTSTLQESTTTTTVDFTIPNPSNSAKPIQCLRVLRSGSCPSRPHSNSHGSPPPPPHPPPALIFTHGAGGTLSAPAVVHFTTGFALATTATRGSVVAFQGSMNLGARVKGFDAVASHYSEPNSSTSPGSNSGGGTSISCFGGRSMGARAAVMASSAHRSVTSLILVSYPLQSEKGAMRDQILLDLPARVRVLFVSGDRDGMCDLGQLDGVRKKMQARSSVVVVRGADHGMGVVGVGPGGKGRKAATEALGLETGRVAAQWLDQIDDDGGGGGELWHGQTEGEIWWDEDMEEVRRSDGKEDETVDKTKSATTTTKTPTHPHPNKIDKTLPPPTNGKDPDLLPPPAPNDDAEAKDATQSRTRPKKRKANPTSTSTQAGVPVSDNVQDQQTNPNPNPNPALKKRRANPNPNPSTTTTPTTNQDQDQDRAVPTPKPRSPKPSTAPPKKSTTNTSQRTPKRRARVSSKPTATTPPTTKATSTSTPSDEASANADADIDHPANTTTTTTTTTRTRSSKRLKK